MQNFIFIILSFMMLSGCAKLAHLQELLTLKDVADNHAFQKKYVHQQNDNFKKLLEAVQNNSLTNGSDTISITKTFGDPILTKEIERDGQNLQRWLYRRADKLYNAEKVYLYFDSTGKLVNWEHIPQKPVAEPVHEVNPKI